MHVDMYTHSTLWVQIYLCMQTLVFLFVCVKAMCMSACWGVEARGHNLVSQLSPEILFSAFNVLEIHVDCHTNLTFKMWYQGFKLWFPLLCDKGVILLAISPTLWIYTLGIASEDLIVLPFIHIKIPYVPRDFKEHH